MNKIIKNTRKMKKGFTLIEILVVVVILGLLAALVVPQVIGQGEDARRTAAAVQIAEIEKALDLYRLHNGFYPSTEQGLAALVTKPTTSPAPRRYADGGYLRRVPVDSWGNPFIYRSPGEKGEVDIVSVGADGEEGGDGRGKDISNHD